MSRMGDGYPSPSRYSFRVSGHCPDCRELVRIVEVIGVGDVCYDEEADI
jgi:hypothetical protein